MASSLTLSEVRSMLPSGLVADALSSSDLTAFRAILPSAQTAAHLRVGACSCDLVRARVSDGREDERHLRTRYRAMGLSRDRIIRELERHRRGAGIPEPPGGWREALAAFVAEHARNAGPTLFLLTFHSGPLVSTAPRRRTVASVRQGAEGWLEEGVPLLVTR